MLSCGEVVAGGELWYTGGAQEEACPFLCSCGLVKWLTHRLYMPETPGSSPGPATRYHAECLMDNIPLLDAVSWVRFPIMVPALVED